MDIRGTESGDRGNPRIRTQRIAEYIGEKARERARTLGGEDVSRTEKARTQNTRKKEARLDQTGGTERADRLEFSSPASRLAEAERSASRLAESDRVSSLRDLYQAGELNTPNRIERAIDRMLERGARDA